MEETKKVKQSKSKKFMLIGVIAFLIIGIVFGYRAYVVIAKSVNHMYKPVQRDAKPPSFTSQEPISILLLGVDEWPGDRGRSDSMVVMTVNRETRTTTMVSIPRDTRAFIASKNTYNKINAAYAYGGVEGTIQTVEQFLNIPIHYYVKVNMNGFKDIVDAVGGIHVNSPLAFTLEGVHISKGKQHMNGDVALKYARMRKEDPRGDFGRQQRQREVIEQIVREGSHFTSIAKYQKVVKALEENVQTNLTMKQMIAIQQNYKGAAKQMKQVEIPGEGGKIGGIWYYTVSDETRLKLSNELRQQLELPEKEIQFHE